uniref:cryptochrome/photolyase family protein n=1 Tax=Thaumasiovibrio occultus TaxID=1891184 RepID=UPI000B35F23E|nr:cryptochrome/photolyase family protein [Thaumasiovibrio occultus]
MKRLRLILGDQLNASHSWFRERSDEVIYLVAEMRQETDYVVHHIQKVCAFFHAMSRFASALEQAGHHVIHLTLDETAQDTDLIALLTRVIKHNDIGAFEYQLPDEWRLRQQLASFDLVPCRAYSTEHFLLEDSEISDFFSPKQHRTMEFFYREMRKRYHVLMAEKGKPEGGKWNLDKENRHSFKRNEGEAIPDPLLFSHDVGVIRERLERHGVSTLGQMDEYLLWPTSRGESRELLDYFCRYLLPQFGRFQDAMLAGYPNQWSVYHSRLSFSLNSKMLSPLEVIQVALDHYQASNVEGSDIAPISLAQIEGFVRQIMGWREYVRGIYWANMPAYQEKNALDAQRDLPAYYWNGDTQMHCMRQAIGQSLEYAYAHHIQRLMITGNFALLTGIAPAQVEAWYLGIYIDAIEWVEMPNTRGMALYADGGIMATKPYAAGGNYINKMSNYCKTCHYDVKQRTGDNACPFNVLYWHFMERHQHKFACHPRTAMPYRNWDNMDPALKHEILATAEGYLARLDTL